MINLISTISILVIIILPFQLKAMFKLPDYFGFIVGIRYLIINSIAQFIFTTFFPSIPTNNDKPVTELEDLLQLPFNDRFKKWGFELLSSFLTFLILYFCISQISKPTINYNTIFLFISGIIIQYILPLVIYMILPALVKNEKIAKVIEDKKMDKYKFTEEFALDSLKTTVFQVINDIGICLIIMFYIKKIVGRSFCYLTYFLQKIVRFFILCVGLSYLDKCFNLVYAIPFIIGIYYYCQFSSTGQLNNKYKEESDFD